MTLRWPWTSVARLDDMRADRDQWKALAEKLSDQLVRMERRERGMPEVPKERPKLEPMPDVLREYIAGFASPAVKKQMRDQCYRRHGGGEPWTDIVLDLMPTEPESEEEE
jgi:hypothetical protein